MIPVDRYEILSSFAGFKAVRQTLHKLYSPIKCERFHTSMTRSFFCTDGISLCQTKFSHLITSARQSGMKKLIDTYFPQVNVG